MAALPELGALSHERIAKLVGVAPLNCDSGKRGPKQADALIAADGSWYTPLLEKVTK